MRKLSSLVMILLFASCASNLPFVNTFDVTKLKDGMTKSEVRSALGKPILMKSDNAAMVWEYKYRTMSNPRMRWENPKKGDSPSKVGGESDFYCIFNNNGQLVEWGSCIDGCEEEVTLEPKQEEEEKEEKKSDCDSKCVIPVNCDCN